MTLLDIYLPIFKTVLQIKSTPSAFEDYEHSRQLCIDLLEQATCESAQHDVSEEEKEAARVAVIAWLDETILRSSLPWRQRWQKELLQRKYLNITTAGEFFFTVLEQLSPQYRQARKVFLFCLQQGFQGQLGSVDDPLPLQSVIAEQRSLCLPEAWQNWPNDAPLVSIRTPTKEAMTQNLRPLLSLTVCVGLLYVALFIFLHNYLF
ncbi:DotU family type IV/VI secretion system protein [Enterobacter sp. Cy-643]|uniref:DotU family type IV/VI secretion system protein n=1 Tax=Enterobacter sp. Cy-643 TaxID=2608346 RepID=UPI00141F5944|nr:DotU family type IV/VI secretion system protein [Enterobacter sp. Cy-643]NIF32453.1 DotU family type IV/VI secretion system protein [Enterobacter sp. Cy-643]